MYFSPKHLKLFTAFLQFDEEIIVYDCETTGFNPEQKSGKPANHIIQLSAKKLKHEYWIGFQVLDEREWYIKPVESIPANIVELTGITDEFLEDYPAEDEVFDEIADYFGNTAVCGYNNIAFDDKFMKEMYKRNGREFHPSWSLDMYKLAVVLISPEKIKNHKLSTVAEYMGFEHSSYHDASTDVDATFAIMDAFEKDLIKRAELTGSMLPSYEAGIKVRVTNVARYEKGKIRRIYVNTNSGATFYMNVSTLGWELKDKGSTDNFNMPDMISQALALARVNSEEELARYQKQNI